MACRKHLLLQAIETGSGMSDSGVIRYFAYGNNMVTQVLTQSIPSAQATGFGRLANHRLAFTLGSRTANLAECPGLSVYGVLYSIDKDETPLLDQTEGSTEEYERVKRTIRTVTGPVEAITHAAAATAAEELSPDPRHLEQLIQGAYEHELPKHYRDFLEYLKAQFALGTRNEGLLLTPTTDRSFSAGEPLIRLNPGDKGAVDNKTFGVMFLDGRKTLGKIEVTGTVAMGTCQADQTVRASAGIFGQWCFGHRVKVLPCQGTFPGWTPIQPRALILPAHAISKNDAEKNYCVLHPDRIKILGLQDGEFIRLFAATLDITEDATAAKAKAITIRVFTGSADEITRSEQEKYPDRAKLYLDMDVRQQLGLPDHDWQGTPVLVRPALGRAFASRALFYGLTILLGIGAVFQILQAFAPQLESYANAAISLVASGAITLWLSIVDLRSRFRY
jgi:gamma-glutamylcyclotransferase (GGCT)/AIG2-like uncharacterized protein YtfP